MKKILCITAAILCPTALFAVDVDLDELRAAVDKYKDISEAIADGYISPDNEHCVSAAAEGLPVDFH